MGKSRKQQIILAQHFFDKGCDQWYAYEFDDALEEFTKALLLRESLLGKYHMHTSRTYFSMGCALHGKGDFEEALIALRRTMRIATVKRDKAKLEGAKDYIYWVLKKHGKDDKEVASYQQQLEKAIDHEIKGDRCEEEWNHPQALGEYKKALHLESAAAGTGHVDVADLYVKIADAMVLNGDDSIDYYRKALKIYTEAFGENHPYSESTFQKMDPAKARKMKAKSPSRGLQREISVQELLRSDQNASHVDKAVKHFHRDRSEFRKDGKRYDTAGRYFWMGCGFHMNGKPEEALVTFRRAWRMRDETYGRDHYQTRHVLGWISDVLQEQGRPVQPYLKSMYKSVDHERSGEKLFTEGEKISALREFELAAKAEETSVGRNHLEYADLKDKIAGLLAEKADYDTAIDVYRTALLIYQTALGRNHPVTSAVFSKMKALSKSSNILLVVSSPGPKSNLSSGCRRNLVTGLGLLNLRL
jgi:tetratricopeptide (TPR) repeat protein